MSDKRMASQRGRRPVTLLDVAHKAGVSRATASLVVRKSPLVSGPTREAVEKAMAELGYVYNLGAARLRASQSHTVGVIVPNLVNPFFSILLAGVESVLEEAGLSVILANSRESAQKQAGFLRRMREHAVDGLIVCPSEGSTAEDFAALSESGVPLVQALRFVEGAAGDYSGIDYKGGMEAATRRLIELGHRRIGFVGVDATHSAVSGRLAGLRAALDAEGLEPAFIMTSETDPAVARALAPEIAARRGEASAIACFNDVIGLGLHRGLIDAGIELGRDLSLLGFDDVPEADLVVPGLASVSTAPGIVGENAAKLLLRRIADPDAQPQRLIAPTRLAERPSIGAYCP